MTLESVEQRLEAAENAKELVDVIAWATGPARKDVRLLLAVAKAVAKFSDLLLDQTDPVLRAQAWDALSAALDAAALEGGES